MAGVSVPTPRLPEIYQLVALNALGVTDSVSSDSNVPLETDREPEAIPRSKALSDWRPTAILTVSGELSCHRR